MQKEINQIGLELHREVWILKGAVRRPAHLQCVWLFYYSRWAWVLFLMCFSLVFFSALVTWKTQGNELVCYGGLYLRTHMLDSSTLCTATSARSAWGVRFLCC